MRIYERYTDAELAEMGLSGDRPKHVGIIMDGNGRWAKQRLMPRSFGHRAGMEALHEIVREAHCLGIKTLTVYAFSTENWRRPIAEVNALFGLLTEYFEKEIDELDANGVRIVALGDLEPFPQKVKACMVDAIERTKNNEGLNFCIAINYGSRAEIVSAIKRIVDSGIPSAQIGEELVSDSLYTSGQPELDLIIRTAGEQRLSNFLLWQAAYAEFVFTPVCWPDFDTAEFRRCIAEFMKRTRRFGKVVE
ncbi:MAG: isoprenyl transferase [Clostridia bacterium]|nr:isoprenyl transferase [Clostridia bacterium]